MYGVVAGVVIVYGLIILGAFALSIVSYVFQGLGLWAVAKRRNVAGAWTAWVPGANVWLLGAIADNYNFKTKGKKSNLRIWLLILYIVLIVMYIAYIVFAITSGVLTILSDGAPQAVFAALVPYMLISFICFVVAAVCSVLRYIALYKFYKSCAPSDAVLFLILAIVASVVTPFLIFYVRNKDEGMIE